MSVSGHKLRHRVRAGVALLAAGACVAGLPSALAAVSASDMAGNVGRAVSIAARGGLGSFTPASIDPKLLESLRTRIGASDADKAAFRFTPAGTTRSGNRTVTVAVRVDPQSVKSIRTSARTDNAAQGIAPVAFNLGMAQGYQSFAQGQARPAAGKGLTLPSDIRKIDAPDLSRFTPAKSGASRFTTEIEVADDGLPGRSPRTIGGDSDISVGVGGAYRVTSNLRVTAGIRYSSDRDRLTPLTDAQQDSQAVYVGTKFQF